MAVTTNPPTFTDTWTELPSKPAFEVTATRLQMVLFNIFQILELECNSSLVAEKDFQEAVKLVSDMKTLGTELEKKLQGVESQKCESVLKTTTKLDALQKQIAGLKAKAESMDQENSILKTVVAEKDENLKAALSEKEKLERLTEKLRMELEEKRTKDETPNRTAEDPEDAVPVDSQNTTPSASDKVVIAEFGSLKKNLEVHKQLYADCEGERKRLWELIKTLQKKQASLTEKTLSLNAALNISRQTNAVSRDVLQRTQKVNRELTTLMQHSQQAQVAQINAINHTDVIAQACVYHTRSRLSHKMQKLSGVFESSKRLGTYTQPDMKKLRGVLRGRQRDEALFEATKEGDTAAVFALLRNRANPMKCDAEGYTPLQWSAKMGHVSVAEVLIQYGHVVDVDKTLPRCLAATPLHLAALEGHIQVAHLLLDLGADINAETRDGSSALHVAVLEGNDNVVQLLMSRGADAWKKNHQGRTPIDLAATMRHHRIQKMLLETNTLVRIQPNVSQSEL